MQITLNAKDFRIGNMIADYECEPYYFDIESISLVEGVWVSYRNGSFHSTIDNLEPIEITEDWLECFGFENIRKNGSNYFTKDSDTFTQMRLAIINDICHISVGNDNEGTAIAAIRYVHELQNLFFSLTGEELKLK